MGPLILAAALAAPATASCPMTLPQGVVAVRAPAGWHGYAPPPFVRLTSFGMMAGPPESMTYLVPDASVKRTKRSSTWRFAAGEEKWLYCAYDDSAAIQISKPLDSAATECTITYKETKRDGITAMTAVCK